MENNIDEILKDRGSRYGAFDMLAYVSQSIKAATRNGPSYRELRPYMVESLEMIAHKMSRIVNGDPTYEDSWVDIAGYAQLVVKQIDRDRKSEIAQGEQIKDYVVTFYKKYPTKPNNGN